MNLRQCYSISCESQDCICLCVSHIKGGQLRCRFEQLIRDLHRCIIRYTEGPRFHRQPVDRALSDGDAFRGLPSDGVPCAHATDVCHDCGIVILIHTRAVQGVTRAILRHFKAITFRFRQRDIRDQDFLIGNQELRRRGHRNPRRRRYRDTAIREG